MKLHRLLYEEKYTFDNHIIISVIDIYDLYESEELPEQSLEFNEDNFHEMIKHAYDNLNKEKVEQIYNSFTKRLGEITDWPELIIISIKNGNEIVYSVLPDTKEIHEALQNRDKYTLIDYINDFKIIEGDNAEQDTIERYLKLNGRWIEEESDTINEDHEKESWIKNVTYKIKNSLKNIGKKFVDPFNIGQFINSDIEDPKILEFINKSPFKEAYDKIINTLKNKKIQDYDKNEIKKLIIQKARSYIKDNKIDSFNIQQQNELSNYIKEKLPDIIIEELGISKLLPDLEGETRIESISVTGELIDMIINKLDASDTKKQEIKKELQEYDQAILQDIRKQIEKKEKIDLKTLQDIIKNPKKDTEEETQETQKTQEIENIKKKLEDGLKNKFKYKNVDFNSMTEEQIKELYNIFQTTEKATKETEGTFPGVKKPEILQPSEFINKPPFKEINDEIKECNDEEIVKMIRSFAEKLFNKNANPSTILKIIKEKLPDLIKKKLEKRRPKEEIFKEIKKIGENEEGELQKIIDEIRGEEPKKSETDKLSNIADEFIELSQDQKIKVLYQITEIFDKLNKFKDIKEIIKKIIDNFDNKEEIGQSFKQLLEQLYKQLPEQNIENINTKDIIKFIKDINKQVDKSLIDKIEIDEKIKDTIDKNMFNNIVDTIYKIADYYNEKHQKHTIYQDEVWEQYKQDYLNKYEDNNIENYARIKFKSIYNQALHRINSNDIYSIINLSISSDDRNIAYLKFIADLIDLMYSKANNYKDKCENNESDKSNKPKKPKEFMNCILAHLIFEWLQEMREKASKTSETSDREGMEIQNIT